MKIINSVINRCVSILINIYNVIHGLLEGMRIETPI